MELYLYIAVFIVLLGSVSLAFQIIRIIMIDARSRGFKHPTFWGFFALSGNNGTGGLILYLLGRHKYPQVITDTERSEIETRKKKAGVSLLFLVTGCIALFSIFTLYY